MGLLAADLLMLTATDAERAEARSLLLSHYGEGGLPERTALCEVLRQMATRASLLGAWIRLNSAGEAAVSADGAMAWRLAALANDSALQRRMDSGARRADEREAAAQAVADGLRLFAPRLVDLPTLSTWPAAAEGAAREHGYWPLVDVADVDAFD